jgi:2-dehydro-3-deoxygluconokinase
MDLVTFGEAMVRLTPPGWQRLEQARSLDVHVGGAELNVAVAAARLGLAARWVSRLPDNALGRLIAGRAREQGVDLSQVAWTADGRAGLYFAELGAAPRAGAVLYDRAGSATSRLAPGMIDWGSALGGARWFHTSGVTPALSDSAEAAVEEAMTAARAAGLTVSYDLNYRAGLWSADRARAVQEPLLRHVDVLIVGEGTARLVFGIDGDAGRALQERFGVGVVAVTTREEPRAWLNGTSAVVTADGVTHRGPSYEVEVVDRIGAGDAFVGGLIFGRLRHGDWDTAVRYATALAALKHTVPGDFSQATVGEVDQLLAGSSLRLRR